MENEAGQNMKYKYNPKTHSVDELPEMEKPILRINTWQYTEDCKAYNEHIASLKSYPLPAETPAPDNWPEVLEINKHFELKNSGFNIYSKKGTKVTTDKELMSWGYNSDKEKAEKYLKPDEVYTIEKTDVHSFSTDVYLQEFPKVSFNSVHFKSTNVVAIPINNKIIMDKNFREKEVIDAYVWIRQNNTSIPDDVLDLMKDAALEKLIQSQVQSAGEEITHFHINDNSDAFRDWLKQKNIEFIPNGHFTSISIHNDIYTLGYQFALYKLKHQPK